MEVLQDVIFGAGTTIKQCQGVSHSNEVNLLIGRDSGDVDPALTAVLEAGPTTTATSFDVAGFIGVFGVTAGALVEAGTVSLPFQKRANGSTFAGASSHFTMTGTNAYGYPTQYTATQGGEATATADIMFLSTDGETAPLSSATGTSLSASTYNAAYSLGPAKIGSGMSFTQLPEVTGVTVAPGLQVEVRRFNGNPYPEKAVIVQRNPTIEITVADLDSIDDYGPMFSSNDNNDAVVYFRKALDGSARVSNATAQHIAFTLSGGIVTVQDFSAQDTSDGSATLLVTGKSLAVSATSAISI